MIHVIFTKYQLRKMFFAIRYFLKNCEVKQDQDLIKIMDKLAVNYDKAKIAMSPVKMLFSNYDARLLWTTIKTILDDEIEKDPQNKVDLIDCLTVLAVGLEE